MIVRATISSNMFTAKYPIKNATDFVTIALGAPEDMPPLIKEKVKEHFGDSFSDEDIEKALSQSSGDKSKIAQWSVCAPGLEKHDHSCGIDDLQCLLLSMKSIAQVIEEWEKNTGNKCEYTFSQDMKIIYSPHFLKQ